MLTVADRRLIDCYRYPPTMSFKASFAVTPGTDEVLGLSKWTLRKTQEMDATQSLEAKGLPSGKSVAD